jgi:hypothetical protein
VTINYGHKGVKVKTGDFSTKVKWLVMILLYLKGKQSILIVSPTSAQIRRVEVDEGTMMSEKQSN